jgi:protein transport protein SEC24
LKQTVPQFFDYDSRSQQYIDRYARPELTHCAVEYVAPGEYMVRPPQAPTFVFVVDVSFASTTSGMLATFARTLAETLDSIPNDERRTRIGFITVDSSIHFYNLEVSDRIVYFSSTTRPIKVG